MPARTDASPRVLLVGQGPPAKGGIPTFISGLLHAASLGARTSYLNTTHDPTRPGGASLDNLRWTVEDAGRLFRAARRVDVVHFHLAPAPLLPLLRAIALVAVARAAGARTLLHAHSGRLHVAARSLPYRLALRLLVLVGDRIVVVSREGARTVEAAGGDPVLVPNAVDAAAFPRGPRGDARLSLTFVGTVCERKGLEDLRKALRILGDEGAVTPERAQVTIVGDGRQEGPGVFERVRDAYAADGLGWVTFTGALPSLEVAEILGATDVFCLPSHWEGLPLSLLEAMAAGDAVVATRVGDIPDVLDGGESGLLVEPHDPSGLADAIRTLVADDELRRRLADAARRKVLSTYDLPAMTARIGELYRELAYSR